MAKGIDTVPTIPSIRMMYAPEQVLAAFGVEINDNNKCLCPYHDETIPSMQVNEEYVYCFGCKTSADSFKLAEQLLSKKFGRKVSKQEVLTFFKDNHLPLKTDRKYTTSTGYQGDVPEQLVQYWASCMDDDRYAQLERERLIVKETAQQYHIGWRPDWEGWSIPFYRGKIGSSLIDVVQFRLTTSPDKKYVGLSGHNRGTVMNADLLETIQDYIIVLFGSFDAILARQDGIPAVGLNGCNPFKKTENERVKALFSKQHTVIIVPDNTPDEFTAAASLAKLVNGQVRYFPRDLPDGCDYIDYRKLGKTSLDFLQDVVGVEPVTQVDENLLANITELLKVGDAQKLSSVHALMDGRGNVARDVALTVAKCGPLGPFSTNEWARARLRLWQVKTVDDLVKTLDFVSQQATLLKQNAW